MKSVSMRFMKTICYQSLKYIALAFCLSCAGMNLASANSVSAIYTSKEIHHYASNGGSPTVTVLVPHHYRFENGKYVWIPSYYAEAPLPLNKYSAVFWM